TRLAEAGVNDWSVVWARNIPLLVRRGGCGIKKISAKPTLAPQTGWSLISNVSVERRLLLMAPPYRACAGSARRPFQRRRLRGILLMSRPPPPHEAQLSKLR